MSDEKKFEQWAIVNLFGHQKMGALVTEQAVGGVSFVRADIPATSSGAPYTRLLGAGAIYSIDFVSEEVARAVAEHTSPQPVQSWEVPRLSAPLENRNRDRDPNDDNDGVPW